MVTDGWSADGIVADVVVLSPWLRRGYGMGMPVAREKWWTAQMARELPDDGNRYEVVDGELLVSPSPSLRHQRAVALLHLLLAPYARATGALFVHVAPCEIQFSEHRAAQPDLYAVRLVNGKMPTFDEQRGNVVFAVEVLSPSTARNDRRKKRPMFQSERVELWIVDTDARLIERWTPDESRPEILTDRLEWQPIAEHAALVIDLEAYFADVWEEESEKEEDE
jgi:Uma2 family endonuclease